jgi:hypothetical protein
MFSNNYMFEILYKNILILIVIKEKQLYAFESVFSRIVDE